MKPILLFASALVFAVSASQLSAQTLPTGWDELTSPDFALAVERSAGVCILPMGVIEKHGPHLPLGTDVFSAREVSRRAAAREYAVVYPFYHAGQIFEARQQPGTIAYSPELLYRLLDETCAEIARNGLRKIILVNSHGGNTSFLQYFCQTQLSARKDYAVYLFQPTIDAATAARIASMRTSSVGGHADEVETSTILAIRPDLVRMDAVGSQSGEDLGRLSLANLYTGIWWYARYPNHYAGESSGATAELGEVRLAQWSDQLADVIGAVKRDDVTSALQDEFFTESESPLETPVH
jgi:creatinine amidohydrolase